MGQDSNIEWTEATWNPIAGCTPVSPGCLNCYAATMSHRLEHMGQAKYHGLTVLNGGRRMFNGAISFDEGALSIPLRRKKPTTWFVNSMSDLCHEAVPFEFVDKVFAVMALTPHHTYQILTKRPERMAEYLQGWYAPFGSGGIGDPQRCLDSLRGVPGRRRRETIHEQIGDLSEAVRAGLPNVWLGTSVENQKCADERIPHLLKCPAAVRFLSVEPMLEAVRLSRWVCSICQMGAGGCSRHQKQDAKGIDWVIVGGEGGHGARPFNLEWARSIVGQCKAAGVACFVKQMGSRPVYPIPGREDTRAVNQPFMGSGWGYPKYRDPKGGDMSEWPEDLRVREMPSVKQPQQREEA